MTPTHTRPHVNDPRLCDLLSQGVYVGGVGVLARARLAFDESVTLKLAVRSESAELAQLICSALSE